MLKDWPNLVNNFRKSYDTRPEVSTENPIPAIDKSSSEEQKLLHAGIHNLLRANRRQAGKNFMKVMFNIDVLVFCLWWFGAVSYALHNILLW